MPRVALMNILALALCIAGDITFSMWLADCIDMREAGMAVLVTIMLIASVVATAVFGSGTFAFYEVEEDEDLEE